jgi:hypothetical protein
MLDRTPSRHRPSFGRPRAVRGLDLFDTPPIALEPLFAHEPLLQGVTSVAEPFSGKGNLVIAMRARELIVHASDIRDRGCPDSTVRDFRHMAERPPGCDVLVSNPPYADAMGFIEHAWALGFRVVVLLLKLSFLCTVERFERLHKRGHLRRVHVLAERLQDMHDANYSGEKASQSQVHAWFVFDRDYCGPATINPVSIHQPAARMPWAEPARQGDNGGNGYQRLRASRDNGPRGYHPAPRGTSRVYVLERLRREGRDDLAALVMTGTLSVRGALRLMTARSIRRDSDLPTAEQGM